MEDDRNKAKLTWFPPVCSLGSDFCDKESGLHWASYTPDSLNRPATTPTIYGIHCAIFMGGRGIRFVGEKIVVPRDMHIRKAECVRFNFQGGTLTNGADVHRHWYAISAYGCLVFPTSSVARVWS